MNDYDRMNAYSAYQKASKIRRRSYELEPIIMQNAGYAFCYARDVIKGRWPEAEKEILRNARHAYYYAKNVIKARWFEAEPIIIESVVYAFWYAKYVIKDRWLESEEKMIGTEMQEDYIEHFFDEPVITKDQVDIVDWQRNKQVGYFAPASIFKDKVSLLDMVIE